MIWLVLGALVSYSKEVGLNIYMLHHMHIIKCLLFGNLFGLYIFHHISICFISIFSHWMYTVHIFRIKTKKPHKIQFSDTPFITTCRSVFPRNTPVINTHMYRLFNIRGLGFNLHLSACVWCVWVFFPLLKKPTCWSVWWIV